jgi:nitrogen fixation protein NifU and related proteins
MNEMDDKDLLLDHVRHPRHTGELSDADGIGECKNPVCGDIVKVWRKDVEVKMKVSGCAICIASASLMVELVNGREDAEILSILYIFRENMKAGVQGWPKELGSLSALKRMRESPMKIPCTLVGWLALERSLSNKIGT